jgi:hypothetical protein
VLKIGEYEKAKAEAKGLKRRKRFKRRKRLKGLRGKIGGKEEWEKDKTASLRLCAK